MTNSFLFPSILVVGADKKEREKKVEELLGLKLSQQLNNPDFMILSSEKSLGIETIRQLQKSLHLKAFKGGKKIAFIKEAQNLTLEAQNALLKTLEEPSPSSILILSAPDEFLLLPTIVSRCQIIQLSSRPQINLSGERLAEISENLPKLLRSSVGERLVFAESEKIYQDRQKALLWLDELTWVARQQLLSSLEQGKSSSQLALIETLKALLQAKKYLSANCNVRLVLEVFLSRLPNLKKA